MGKQISIARRTREGVSESEMLQPEYVVEVPHFTIGPMDPRVRPYLLRKAAREALLLSRQM